MSKLYYSGGIFSQIPLRFKHQDFVYIRSRGVFGLVASDEKRGEVGYGWDIDAIVDGEREPTKWYSGDDLEHAYDEMIIFTAKIANSVQINGNKITFIRQICPGRYVFDVTRLNVTQEELDAEIEEKDIPVLEKFDLFTGKAFNLREPIKKGKVRSTLIFDQEIRISDEMRADAQRTIDAMKIRYDRIQTAEQVKQGEFKGLV